MIDVGVILGGDHLRSDLDALGTVEVALDHAGAEVRRACELAIGGRLTDRVAGAGTVSSVGGGVVS